MKTSPKDRKAIGDRLSRARITLGLTQADIAERTGFAVSAVSHFETGLRLPNIG